ncbi:sigma-70 family RNA polymerase sigma factor [uncultured Corynebacterium sp.]|uniref:sigma-70 family RNA polymerase sigma factor n=1 Tax=uncultured Corynebacterium sp. TaxID=159447 RepID=UPI0025979ADA|nr:sigma-70 family RNA polymerase sigma factor [uncultured Corynebacterium sp.]
MTNGTISDGARSDQQLVEAYMGGDPRAFTAIVQRHRARLVYVARRYSRNENDVEDILQEALFKASRNMHTYRSEATLSTWLHRLVMNTGFDHVKASRKRLRDVSIDDDERISPEANPGLAHDPTAHLDRTIVVRQALEALPETQRRALVLIDVIGLSVERAAAEMGVQPGTVKSRRARARAALAKAVDGAAGGASKSGF